MEENNFVDAEDETDFVEVEVIPPSFGEKLFNYLEKNQDHLDVTFCVGPQKEKVKALKIALKATCPAMDLLFNTNPEWEFQNSFNTPGNNNSNKNEGISLPDVDPYAFRIFLKLLVADAFSFDEVEALKLSAQTLFNLIAICGNFGMLELKAQLESLAQSFFVDFSEFAQTEDFLKLTRSNLEAILSSDEIPVDEVTVLESACNWAEYQCSEAGLEISGENIRNTLGDTLFFIRFPTMTNTEFGKLIGSRKILTPQEQLEIFMYISLSEKEKPEGMRLPFCTRKRRKNALINSYSTVSFLTEFPLVDEPPFICDGIEARNYFQVNQKIGIHSVGFLGPIDGDAFYDVIVEIFKHSSNSINPVGRTDGRIFAKQKQIFHIFFEEPIILEATYVQEGLYKKFGYYRIEYTLKGPPTQSAEVLLCKNFKTEAFGIGFFCRWDSEQLAEILFHPC